jgi:hypothetical protein
MQGCLMVGCGGPVLLVLLGLLLSAVLPDPRNTPEGQARAAQASADAQRFLQRIRSIDTDGALVVDAKPGTMDHQLDITLSNDWFYQPHQVRIQTAQTLHYAWAQTHGMNLDSAPIRLLDLNGNEIGRSGVWGTRVSD